VSGDLNTGRDQLNQPPTKGTSTTTMVLIGVGALVLIGVAVYFYKKK
jgi:LPXTG-motif cell wall-anchored protein